MMNGVILPHALAVEHAVKPVQQEVGNDEIKRYLQPVRQLGPRPVAVLEEVDDGLRAVNIEDHDCAQYQEADAQKPGEYRNHEPIGEVGRKVAAAPPWALLIAGKAR